MKFNKSLQDCPLQKLAFIHFLQYDDISVLFSDPHPPGVVGVSCVKQIVKYSSIKGVNNSVPTAIHFSSAWDGGYHVNIFSLNCKIMDSQGNICALCQNILERKNKGFKRWRICTVLNATAFGHLFPNHDYSEVQQQFLCQECLNFINIRTVAASKRGIKRKLPPTRDTQPRAKRFKEDPGKKENINIPLERAQDLLGAYKYKTAFNLLAKTSAAARSAIVEVARYIVQQEVMWLKT